MNTSALHHSSKFERSAGLTRLAVLAALLVAPGGCYRNVVGASGTGADNYDIKEANIEPGESVWSEPKPTEKQPDRYSGTFLQKNTRPMPKPPAPPQ